MIKTENLSPQPPDETSIDILTFAAAGAISGRFITSISPKAVATFGVLNAFTLGFGKELFSCDENSWTWKTALVTITSLGLAALAAPSISSYIAIPITGTGALAIAGMNLALKVAQTVLVYCFNWGRACILSWKDHAFHQTIDESLSLEEKQSLSSYFFNNDFPPQDKEYEVGEIVLPQELNQNELTDNQVRWIYLAIEDGLMIAEKAHELIPLSQRFYELKLPVPKPKFTEKSIIDFEEIDSEKLGQVFFGYRKYPEEWTSLRLVDQYNYNQCFAHFFQREFPLNLSAHYSQFTVDEITLPEELSDDWLASWAFQYYYFNQDEWKSHSVAKQIQLNESFANATSENLSLIPTDQCLDEEELAALYQQYLSLSTYWTFYTLPKELQKQLNQKFQTHENWNTFLSFPEFTKKLAERIQSESPFKSDIAKIGYKVFKNVRYLGNYFKDAIHTYAELEETNQYLLSACHRTLRSSPSQHQDLSPSQKNTIYERMQEEGIRMTQEELSYSNGQFLTKSITAFQQMVANSFFFGVFNSALITNTATLSPYILPFYGIAALGNLIAVKTLYKDQEEPSSFAKYLINTF